MNMGTLSTPKTWAPYMNTKDCSQGFCSLNCPQWCYLIFPPPPPMDSSSSSSTFSPLVIAIMGILASAFILVTYYAVISKFCVFGSRAATWPNIDMAQNYGNNNSHESDHVDHNEPWNTRAVGLDESLIKLISVCNYKKSGGVFSSTDCSVCLGEFEEGEALRLLPKCSHAFHVSCIDKWLKTHCSCPLCRSNIVLDTIQSGMLMHQDHKERMGQGGEEHEDLQGVMNLPSEIEEIKDEPELRHSTRRSDSMDDSMERRISIDDDEREFHTKDHTSTGEEAYRILHSAMKRSFSSGRFSFTRRERAANSVVRV